MVLHDLVHLTQITTANHLANCVVCVVPGSHRILSEMERNHSADLCDPSGVPLT